MQRERETKTVAYTSTVHVTPRPHCLHLTLIIVLIKFYHNRLQVLI